MLAKVEPFPAPAVLPPADPAFKVTFDPSATPQFKFTNMDGTPVGNYVQIADDTETISVTLEGASFAAIPIVWSIAPPGGPPVVLLGPTPATISFTVPRPPYYFHPWMFRLIVNADGMNGIRSPNIFLVRQTASDSLTFRLKYAAGNGNFSLLGEDESDSQVGIDLANELVLVNVLPGSFTINLDPDPVETEATFASTPIQWGSGEQPGWITPRPLSPTAPTDKELIFTITEEANGRAASLQFAIVVTNPTTGNQTTILSPDPILINSTIGDG